MSALTESTNINAVIEDDIQKLSSPQKSETVIPEKATSSASDPKTNAEEVVASENVPAETAVNDENAEVKKTVATEATVMKVTSEAVADETAEDRKNEVSVNERITAITAEDISEATTGASTQALDAADEMRETAKTEVTSVDKMEDRSDTAEKTEVVSVTDVGDKIEEAPRENPEKTLIKKMEDPPTEETDVASFMNTVDKTEDVSIVKTEKTSAEKMENSPTEKADEEPTNDAVKKNEEACVEKSGEESTACSSDKIEVEETLTKKKESLVENSSDEIKNKISKNFIDGRRFMKMRSFKQAVEVLSVSAALAAEHYGEAHEDTFEVNFLYGKSLLEVVRVEDGVLTNALTDIPKSVEGDEDVQDSFVGNPEDVPQEERADIKKSVEEALDIVPEEPEAVEEENLAMEGMVNGKTGEMKVQNSDIYSETADTNADVADDVEMKCAEKEETAEEEIANQTGNSESDDDDVKLAWELLETCRCTCERKIKELEAMETVDMEAVKTWKLNQADVLTSLGEHGMVDSKYEQAQKDLLEAIAIQAAHLPATSRILAETTHLLAKAFSMDSLFDKAEIHFNNSRNVLIAKLDELKKHLESASTEEKVGIESEIKELEEVISDIGGFISDARASAEQTEKIKIAAKQELENAAAEIVKISEEDVKDITSMVRRPTKRPASKEPVEESKKLKSEDGAETVPDEKTASAHSEESESATALTIKE